MTEWKQYTFLAGPVSGERRRVPVDANEVIVVVEPKLTDMLEASLKVLKGQLVAVPGPRRAVYRLADDGLYRFVGWQQ